MSYRAAARGQAGDGEGGDVARHDRAAGDEDARDGHHDALGAHGDAVGFDLDPLRVLGNRRAPAQPRWRASPRSAAIVAGHRAGAAVHHVLLVPALDRQAALESRRPPGSGTAGGAATPRSGPTTSSRDRRQQKVAPGAAWDPRHEPCARARRGPRPRPAARSTARRSAPSSPWHRGAPCPKPTAARATGFDLGHQALVAHCLAVEADDAVALHPCLIGRDAEFLGQVVRGVLADAEPRAPDVNQGPVGRPRDEDAAADSGRALRARLPTCRLGRLAAPRSARRSRPPTTQTSALDSLLMTPCPLLVMLTCVLHASNWKRAAMSTVATRRTQAERSATTRPRCSSAARELFAERGFAATGRDEIAERAGVTHGALYHHFDGKDAVLRAVVLEMEAEMVERVSAAARGAAPWHGPVAGRLSRLPRRVHRARHTAHPTARRPRGPGMGGDPRAERRLFGRLTATGAGRRHGPARTTTPTCTITAHLLLGALNEAALLTGDRRRAAQGSPPSGRHLLRLSRSPRRVVRRLAAAFAVFGGFWGGWAVAAADVERALQLSHAEFGLLLSVALGRRRDNQRDRRRVGRAPRDRRGSSPARWRCGRCCSSPAPSCTRRSRSGIVLVLLIASGGFLDVVMNVAATAALADTPGRTREVPRPVQLRRRCRGGRHRRLAGTAARRGGGSGRRSPRWRCSSRCRPAVMTCRRATRASARRLTSAFSLIRRERLLLIAAAFAVGAMVEGGVELWGVLFLRTYLTSGVAVAGGQRDARIRGGRRGPCPRGSRASRSAARRLEPASAASSPRSAWCCWRRPTRRGCRASGWCWPPAASRCAGRYCWPTPSAGRTRPGFLVGGISGDRLPRLRPRPDGRRVGRRRASAFGWGFSCWPPAACSWRARRWCTGARGTRRDPQVASFRGGE